jgi:hypothetical protein
MYVGIYVEKISRVHLSRTSTIMMFFLILFLVCGRFYFRAVHEELKRHLFYVSLVKDIVKKPNRITLVKVRSCPNKKKTRQDQFKTGFIVIVIMQA